MALKHFLLSASQHSSVSNRPQTEPDKVPVETRKGSCAAWLGRMKDHSLLIECRAASCWPRFKCIQAFYQKAMNGTLAHIRIFLRKLTKSHKMPTYILRASQSAVAAFVGSVQWCAPGPFIFHEPDFISGVAFIKRPRIRISRIRVSVYETISFHESQ